jgi:uncharacterized membrane protein YedE/YeeE
VKRPAIALLSAGVSGVLFGIGLSIARMTDPAKIWNFLDIAAIPHGGWDPSLAFVMAGGMLVGIVGLRLDRLLRMPAPVAAPAFIKTSRTRIDLPLVAGAAVFGVGWGLAGFCPGPAIADLGLRPGSVLPFVVAMFAGSWIAGRFMDFTPAKPAGDLTPAKPGADFTPVAPAGVPAPVSHR